MKKATNFYDKKAGSRILLVYWYILFLIVAIVVLITTSLFYSGAIDVKEAEAKILHDKIVECLNNHGKLNSEIDYNDVNSLIKKCDFYLNAENMANYFFLIHIYDKNDDIIKTLKFGQPSIKLDCDMNTKRVTGRTIAGCSEREMFARQQNIFPEKSEEIKINIFTGVRK